MGIKPEITTQITKEVHYEWIYGYCDKAVPAVVISIALILSVKIVVQFLLSIRRKKDNKQKAD